MYFYSIITSFKIEIPVRNNGYTDQDPSTVVFDLDLKCDIYPQKSG